MSTQSEGQNPFSDILTLLRAQGETYGDRIALEAGSEKRIAYRQLLNDVEHLAADTHARIREKVTADKLRIAIVLPNGLEMSVSLLAMASISAALPFNPTYTLSEFESYFAETGVHALLTKGNTIPAARTAAERLGLIIIDLDNIKLDGSASSYHPKIAAPKPNDVALILMTSGSTGRPKKVPLTHRNVCTSARDVCRSLQLQPQDRCLNMWEQFHIGGLVDLLLAPLHSGGTVISTAGFDAAKFFELLRTARPTWFQGVPTSLGELVTYARRNQLEVDRCDLRFLRSVAAALSPALMQEIEGMFGLPIIQTLGMTEASPLIASTQLPPHHRKPGSVGISCGTEIAIFDHSWNRITDGKSGNIAVRGDNVFSGYEDDSAANAEAFRDGWFKTGDMGYIDPEGHLFLTGRTKELINRGGEKINPREVDDAALMHPAVAEAASFSVPHPTLGEDIALAVVSKPNMTVDVAELRTFLGQKLATFKIPRYVHIVEKLPRNAIGKIDRLNLAETYAATQKAAAASNQGLNDIESRIAEIWAQELNVPKVGPDDDFFQLGGDSLSGLRMFLAVEAAFSLNLPPEVLTGLTTVREMARRVVEDGVPKSGPVETKEGHMSEAERHQIVAIMGMGRIPAIRPGSALKGVHRDGTRPPLIWFFNSPATEMLELSKYFPAEQPLYGGYSGGKVFDRGNEKLMQIARLYLPEILETFPTGELIIGGNCQGGRVGFMVAKLLLEAGRPVNTMCFLEFSHPDLAAFQGRLLLMFGKQSKNKSYRHIRWGRSGWKDKFPRVPTVSWTAGTHGGFFRQDTISSLTNILDRFLNHQPLEKDTMDHLSGRMVMWIHRVPGMFPIYRAAYKAHARIRYGKRVDFNPFTGEVMEKQR